MSTYGTVGKDVGVVGRWVRLIGGSMLLLLVLADFLGGTHSHTARTNALIVVFFAMIVLVYHGVYLWVHAWIKGKSPWIPTVIFVVPAMYISTVNAFLVPPELSFGHLIGMPYINHPLTIAMLLYIGLSFPVQFFTRYGGCEVVAIQNLIFRKELTSYCVPLLPLDAVEKVIVDGIAKKRHRTGGEPAR